MISVMVKVLLVVDSFIFEVAHLDKLLLATLKIVEKN